MRIDRLRLFEVEGTWSGNAFGDGWRQAKPIDVYPEFRELEAAPRPAGNSTATYLEVATDQGVSGLFGPLGETAGQLAVIRRDLQPLLRGRDPLATELLHDLMLRLDRHGRSGLFMTAVSAVDCALWDLKGRAWGKPVHQLLGGPTRPAVPAYASMLGFSVEPDRAAAAARAVAQQGYTAQKWFFRHGPGSGEAGLRANIAMAAAVREAVGPDYTLMFDAFMSWDLPYAVRMARALEPLSPYWLEEPLPPEHVGGLRELRRAARVPIATGEHVYTRWQTRELLERRAVDFLQNDPHWTGGITELAKVCALGSAFDVPVVAHGHGLHAALHVAASQSPATVPFVPAPPRAHLHRAQDPATCLPLPSQALRRRQPPHRPPRAPVRRSGSRTALAQRFRDRLPELRRLLQVPPPLARRVPRGRIR